MGTLDDAIREHLDLKRRSGAADDEVTRLENEAFGAARREPPQPAADPQAPREEAVAAEDVPPPPPPAEPVAEPVAHVEPVPAAEPVAADAPEVPAPAPAPPETWLEDDDEDVEPELPAAAPPQPAEPVAGGSHAMSASDYVAPDEEGDDLLEETPDFLQETPEHDRLWFEQKPPRDFDFE